MSIIGAEDEDFENDIEPTRDGGRSKTPPEIFGNGSRAKSMLEMDSFEYRNRPDLIPEDQLKKYLQDIQSFQATEISQQLEDFREKRKMGMTPGEKELFELEGYRTKDKGIREAKEKQLAEQLLVKLEEMHKNGAVLPISGTKKQEEALKPKKGFSILDPARWNRGDSHYSDYRQPKPEGEAAEKTPALDKKTKSTEGTSGRSKGTPSMQDPSGLDSAGLADSGDSPVTEQPLAGEQLSLDESAENERLPGKLGRSESLRVYERKRSQRGSAKGKQPRSRSDVDIEAAARASELEEKPTLEQARQKQGSRK
ncbi:hypothetical protein Chor_005256 [Crotalus horridus]